MKMKIMIGAVMFLIIVGCVSGPDEVEPASVSKPAMTFLEIPLLNGMPDPPRENIRKTCQERWSRVVMNLETFQIRTYKDAYAVECEGLIDGEIWRCVIRVDSNGNWINDGRSKKAL